MSFKKMKKFMKLMKNKTVSPDEKAGIHYIITREDDRVIIDCLNDEDLAIRMRKDLESNIEIHLQINTK